jgi:hypothetical protein
MAGRADVEAGNLQKRYKYAKPTPIGKEAKRKGKHLDSQRACSTGRELQQLEARRRSHRMVGAKSRLHRGSSGSMSI